jgi:hypothetical protein
MSRRNVIDFLRTVAVRADVLDSLKVRSKDEVIAAAAVFGFPFTESEFNTLIWVLEARLAERRGEPFDAHFPLWETMWGQYYLEYLVLDLIPSLKEADINAVMASTAKTR